VAWCLYLLAHAHALFKADVIGNSDGAAAWRGRLDWHQSFQKPSGPTPNHCPSAKLIGQVVGEWNFRWSDQCLGSGAPSGSQGDQ
jgi:hypothetical protein